jgi:hypothetical protein
MKDGIATTFESAIISALAFCVAMAWDNLLKRILTFVHKKKDTLVGDVLYVIFMTAALSVVSTRLSRETSESKT